MAQNPSPDNLRRTADGDNAEAVRVRQGDKREESKAGSKSGLTNLDTIIGKVVVEQGLATQEEVRGAADKHAAEKHEGRGDDPGAVSFAQRLVMDRVITEQQLTRLQSRVEAERSGQQIPGFQVLGKLGAGAMATVFKARQVSLDRMVAIKVLPRKFSSNEDFIRRFYAEGRAAAQLNHPNIVQAFDVGKAGEFHYFVMEYVEGTTVYDQIVQNKRYGEREAIQIVIQTAEALLHAHEKGLIHRDVKPKNVMRTREGVVKLADMGLARAISDKEAAEAEAGKAFGTPYYISPEQIRGAKNLTPAADIYALGATFYHMVTGAVPYNGKTPRDVMRKHLTAELVPPDHVNPKLSAGVGQVIEMMMAKDPGDRHRRCQELLADLRAVLEGETPHFAKPDAAPAALRDVVDAFDAMDPADIPVDATATPSVWGHPAVQLLVAALVVSLVMNAVQLVSS